MKDSKKTKDQLVKELEKLRRSVRSLEKKDAERRQLLEALKESEFKYFALVDQAQDLVVIAQDGIIKFINRAIQISGYRPEEVIGKSFTMLVPAEEQEERLRQHLARSARKDVPASYETRLLCKDGTELNYEVTTSVIQYEGRPAVLAIARNITERKQADIALRESEAKYSAVVEQAGDLVVILQDGVIKFVNPAITQFGFTREEVQGKPFLELISPTYQQPMLELHQAHMTGQDIPTVYETTLVSEHGETLTMEVAATIIQYQGQPAVLAIARNVTERKRAENALRESEAKYSALVDHARDMVIVAQDGVIKFTNPSIERFGFTREEAVGTPFLELLAPESAEAVAKMHQRRMNGKDEASHYESRFKTRDGRLIDVDVSAAIIQYEGNPAVMAIVRDVSDRKQAEEALRESEERHRSLFESSRDAIFLADAGTGEILEANAAAAELMKLPVGKIVGLHQKDLHPPKEEAFYRATFAEHVSSGKAITTDIYIQRPDGEKVPIDISAATFKAGGRSYILGIFRDMTDHKLAQQERQKLQAQIQHAQKLESLGVLAGGIAHDFNNLLMGVLGNASLALLELPDWSKARPHVEKIEKASQHAAELTKQMLAYSGKGKFMVQDVDISELVEEMTDLLKVSISKKAALKYEFSKEPTPIEADATQIRQVIMNLITNASDAIGEESGIITVRTGLTEADRTYLASTYLDDDLPAGHYAFLEVSDTGSGMDRETKARIFDPFFSSKFAGRGLGLAAVLGIVRGHRGAIVVYSEPGKGTTFKVLFPIKEPVESQPVDETEESWAPTTGKTILIVDDEETVRDVARNMLESFDFKVLMARDGREGLEVFRQNQDQIAAVLLDYTMPNMDGVETFRELHAIQPGVRVILSSGYNELEATHRFTGKGLAGFIQKPYRLSQLIDKMREVLEKT